MASLYDFEITTIEGEKLPLETLRGKAVLFVNVASRCGYTPQYEGLEKLSQELASQGLVVVGVPCNDFGAQEPGTEEDIKTFCTTRFGVTFPLTSKVAVLGAAQHPLYRWLTTEAVPPGDVKWNFEKFLVGRDGQLETRFPSNVGPEAAELRQAIASALG